MPGFCQTQEVKSFLHDVLQSGQIYCWWIECWEVVCGVNLWTGGNKLKFPPRRLEPTPQRLASRVCGDLTVFPVLMLAEATVLWWRVSHAMDEQRMGWLSLSILTGCSKLIFDCSLYEYTAKKSNFADDDGWVGAVVSWSSWKPMRERSLASLATRHTMLAPGCGNTIDKVVEERNISQWWLDPESPFPGGTSLPARSLM